MMKTFQRKDKASTIPLCEDSCEKVNLQVEYHKLISKDMYFIFKNIDINYILMILIKTIDKMCDKTYVIKCDSIC